MKMKFNEVLVRATRERDLAYFGDLQSFAFNSAVLGKYHLTLVRKNCSGKIYEQRKSLLNETLLYSFSFGFCYG